MSLLQSYASEQARIRPDSVAIVMREVQLSYAELESQSNRFAQLLKSLEVKRGDRVCLFMAKSPQAVVAMHGVMKADAVYVPIDSSSPAARVAKIVEAAAPKVFLTEAAAAPLVDDLFAQGLLDASVVVGTLETAAIETERFQTRFSGREVAAQSDTALEYSNSPADIAHLLFTSGSTGTPKGVMITHANVSSFLDWTHGYFQPQPGERLSGHPPLHFDLSTFDIYGALRAGAALHMVPSTFNLLPNKLAAFIRDSALQQWFSVPSTLTHMAKFDVVKQGDFPALKRLLWCGEPMPAPTLTYFMERLPHVTFTNLYGPTEATIASSYYTMPGLPASDTENISIGVACDGEELLVLNDMLQAVAVDEIGELFIAGDGLSPGYWQDEVKTAAAFLDDPRPGRSGKRIYRTGDLGRVDATGLFYCLGRVDSQIKSRGYRIELGEVEAAVNTLSGIKECAVVGVAVGGLEGTAICCAYAPQESGSMTESDLQRSLRSLLPRYMIPSRWITFKTLPKNANGKIDRKQLRDAFEETL